MSTKEDHQEPQAHEDQDQAPADQRSPLERLRGSLIELADPFEPVGEEDWEALR